MMDSGYLTTPLAFLVRTLFDLYILVVILRFFLQLTRSDFYNPLSQLVVRATSPLLTPLRRLIPGLRGMDLAALTLAWGLETLKLMILHGLQTGGFRLLLPLFMAVPELIALAFDLFFWAILIQAILSWVTPPGGYNPAGALLHTLTRPLLRPAQRLIPPIGGIDLSPMAVMLALVVAEMLVVPPLRALALLLGG